MSYKDTNYKNEPLSSTDTEIESEVDPIDHTVRYNIQEMNCPEMCALAEFFTTKMINGKGDPTTNIIDRMKGICYNVPKRKIPKLFKLLERCRKANRRLMYAERQTEEPSGIMLDFDIKQNTEHSQIDNKIFNRLTQKIVTLLMKILDTDEEVVYVGFTRKPHIIYDDTLNCYKDGFHMLIPNVMITKRMKKFLIQKIIDNEIIDRIMDKVAPATNIDNYNRHNFLDVNSAYVPVFLVGSASKLGSPPYKMSVVYKVEYSNLHPLYIEEQNDKFKDLNLCYEFSLNFESDYIHKKVYRVREEYIHELSNMTTNSYIEETSTISTDPKYIELQGLVDILSDQRADDYNKWYKVLLAIASVSHEYKQIAIDFSKKSSKFHSEEFDVMWERICNSTYTGKKLTIGSIRYWAKKDNYDRYKEFECKSILAKIKNLIYTKYRSGVLTHYDVASICYDLLKDKYVTDRPDGEKHRVWYEFIIDTDKYIDGELYKWIAWNGTPTSLSIFISTILPDYFDKALKHIIQNLDKTTEDNMTKFYKVVLRNFTKTMLKLGDRPFKINVLKEAEDLFNTRGFVKELDSNPLIRGVANGILKLSIMPSEGPRLIQGYHNYKVSKYVNVPFVPFDPYDELTKEILCVLRNLFPDDEPDSFEFTMYYLASTLDSRPKDSMFMITIGRGKNGKSFIMELHKNAIGDYCVRIPLAYLTSRSTNADSATPAVMMLQHASLATYSESNKNELLNSARIKELTGLETIAGRKLHQNMINFKPNAHHWICSNYDLDLGGAVEYGLERRIEYNPLKIRFVDPKIDNYDKDDPYQRIADDKVNKEWTSNPKILGRYLGIMSWYHWWLYRKYNGKVKMVPHPHINYETNKYIRRQDLISKFITSNLVKTPPIINDDGIQCEQKFKLSNEIQKYAHWHNRYYGAIDIKGLVEMFKDKKPISQHLRTTRHGIFLVGYRFLSYNEELDQDSGEVYAINDDTAYTDEYIDVKPETTEEFYKRICREYDESKNLFFNQVADSTPYKILPCGIAM